MIAMPYHEHGAKRDVEGAEEEEVEDFSHCAKLQFQVASFKFFLIKQIAANAGAATQAIYSGMFPCFLRGMLATLFSSIWNPLMSLMRV